MKVKVKIEEQTFEVEIGNLRERPVIGLVDGERIEVWPDEQAVARIPTTTSAERQNVPSQGPSRIGGLVSMPPGTSQTQSQGNGILKCVRAPIPGVITQVNVQQGDLVSVGQQLCVLEAMKMNNSIRASRAGRVGTIHVSTGQHVRHNDPLIEYCE